MNWRPIGKKRLPTKDQKPLVLPVKVKKGLIIDFMSDALGCSMRFRTFNVPEDFNRELLSIEVDLNSPAARVLRVLERIAARHSFSAQIIVDNGTEFISATLAD